MPKWTGGWRPDKAPSELLPHELELAYNIELTSEGGIRNRAGMEEVSDEVTDLDEIEFLFSPRVFTTSGTGISSQPIFQQIVSAFNQSDGSIYIQNFGQIYEDHLDDAEGADLTDTGHSLGNAGGGSSNYFRIWPITAMTWEDNIYYTSLRFNGFSGGSGAGGSWETQGGTGSTDPSLPAIYDVQDDSWSRPDIHDLDGSTSGFPRARTALVKYNRFFAANVHKGGAYRYPSRIYWSDAGTAETWDTNSWIGVGADDGTEITALIPFGEQIIVFKNDSVWQLSGTDEDTFALYALDDLKGCNGTYAATSTPNHVYFFDERNCMVWRYDGAQFDDIGRPIAQWLQQNINKNASSKVVLQVVNDQLWLSFPNNTFADTQSDKNALTVVYDLRHQCWASWWSFGIVPSVIQRESDYVATGPDGVIEGDANPYFALTTSNRDDVIMKGYMGLNDDDADSMLWQDYGTGITSTWRTFWYAPGGGKNRIRRAEALISPQNDGDLDTEIEIQVFRDLYGTAWQSYNVQFDDWQDNVVEFHHQTSEVDIGRWTWLAFGRNEAVNGMVRVNTIKLTVSSEQHPRGKVMGTNYHDTEVGCI